MKKSIALFTAVAGAVLFGGGVHASEQKQKPETGALPASAYRVPLDEIIVQGREPYWRHEASPRFDKPKVEAPKLGDSTPSRLQWAPHYNRDERDDYNGVRDQLSNPPPRAKIFEIHF